MNATDKTTEESTTLTEAIEKAIKALGEPFLPQIDMTAYLEKYEASLAPYAEQESPLTPWGLYALTTSNNTNGWMYKGEEENRTFDDLRQQENELTEENARLRIEMDNIKELLALRLEQDHITKRQLLIVNHMKRLEHDKGWELAFLSPSVVELLHARCIEEFLEGDVRFFFDAINDDRG